MEAETETRSEMLPVAPAGAAEESLISQSTWGAVRALWERGVAKKAIARELGLDIKTVRKWCRQSWVPQRRPQRGSVLDGWEGFLRARAPEVGFNAVVLYREIGGSGSCTGTLIGPKHVLTAAHCVVGADCQFRNGSIRFRLAQYLSGPCSRPYGTHYAVRAFVPTAYAGGDLSAENKAWDYAVIELANEIPEAASMAFDYLSWNTIQGLTPYSVGYPGDKTPADSLWQTGSSNVFLDNPYRYLDNGDRGLLYATTDTAGGQSGSPIYVFQGGQRVIVGVLLGGPSNGSECLLGRNWASRLTPGAVERIENAMIHPDAVDPSLRVRNVPLAQILADEPPADCN